MFSILAASASIKEFSSITHLIQLSSSKDVKGAPTSTLPTSDPNTVHNLISFMHLRSSIISMCDLANRFKKLFSSNAGTKKQSNRMTPNIHPKIIL